MYIYTYKLTDYNRGRPEGFIFSSYNTERSAQWTVFANGQEPLSSIPGRVIPKTQKLALDASLLNIQDHKFCIKEKWKVKQSREKSSAYPYTSV